MTQVILIALVWSMGEPMPHQKSCRITALAGGKVVTVGGTWWGTSEGADKPDRKHWIDDVWGYDPSAGKWAALPKYPRPVAYGCAAVVGEVLYVIGGCDGVVGGADGKDGISDCYRMDFGRKPLVWEKTASLPLPLWNANAAAIGKTIYLVGGRTGNPSYTGKFELVSDVLALDTSKGAAARWEKAASLPLARAGSAAAAAGGKLYVLGGSSTDGKHDVFLREVLSWDPRTRKWNECASLRRPVAWPCGVAYRGRYVMFLGGYGEVVPRQFAPDGKALRSFLSEVWMYDVKEDRHLPGTPMMRAVLDSGAACDGESIYVIGGEDTPNRTRADWLQIARIWDPARSKKAKRQPDEATTITTPRRAP